jgi:hypothetical protein
MPEPDEAYNVEAGWERLRRTMEASLQQQERETPRMPNPLLLLVELQVGDLHAWLRRAVGR